MTLRESALDNEILKWRNAEAEIARTRGESMFLGKPDSWFENPHWFCRNGHVSRRILKCEDEGDTCLGCGAPVRMGPAITESEFAPILSRLRSTAESNLLQ